MKDLNKKNIFDYGIIIQHHIKSMNLCFRQYRYLKPTIVKSDFTTQLTTGGLIFAGHVSSSKV